ncbi:hypothetical protein AVEN_250918-1 [Araneus ventricosus]|uniref:Integrase zinc-binding domain-containing protein n=1 Tax=Araneus ventricosus TaxID=182803 RepID=A0A4Y2SK19_ARAVE|nr:hypothetical protein AVEN_250918-1 [Araneus ventricosus]
MTKRLIEYLHIKNCHAGAQILLSVVIEKFGILWGRRPVRNAIRLCVRCKRYNARSVNSGSVPLPVDRIRDTNVFDVTGIDFAGPLFLKNGEKVWIVVFTCALYRAVHFELASSLSKELFCYVFVASLPEGVGLLWCTLIMVLILKAIFESSNTLTGQKLNLKLKFNLLRFTCRMVFFWMLSYLLKPLMALHLQLLMYRGMLQCQQTFLSTIWLGCQDIFELSEGRRD